MLSIISISLLSIIYIYSAYLNMTYIVLNDIAMSNIKFKFLVLTPIVNTIYALVHIVFKGK